MSPDQHHSLQKMTFEDCEADKYYASAPTASHDALHNLLKLYHRNVIPYTAAETVDVWDALKVLDSGPDGEETVNLIYRNIAMSNDLQGKTSGWNREHLWPKSYGVGYSGPDFSDLHHLRPADWGVNSARGNKLFGPCFDADSPDCSSPANKEAAEDTESDKERWLPPAHVRGDIARAMFYMDIRYDGEDDPEKIDLVLSDCPSKEKKGSMGYKRFLLQWHLEDPVDQAERERNELVCEYQGNRNVFVDYPAYVAEIFGEPDEEVDCEEEEDENGEKEEQQQEQEQPAHTEGTCDGLAAGDIAIVAFNSKGNDNVLLVALNDVPGSTTIYLTDNAWSGSSLYANEGVVKLTAPEGGIGKGTVFGYNAGLHGNFWKKDAGSFALTTSGNATPRRDRALNMLNMQRFVTRRRVSYIHIDDGAIMQ